VDTFHSKAAISEENSETSSPRGSSDAELLASQVLEELLTSLPQDRFTLGWLSSHLHKRSFGIIVLVLALIAMVPGISYVAGLLLLAPAIEMIAGHVAPTFPRWVSTHSLSVSALKSTVQRLVPVLKHLEKAIRPRWRLSPGTMKRVVGVAILLLTVLLLVTPLPLIQIVPGIIIIILAVAYLEDDGLLLAVGLLATLAFTAASAGAVWGMIAGVKWIALRG
jgi:hypothetical protein